MRERAERLGHEIRAENGVGAAMGAKEAVAKAFRMDEVAWRRHANPWSVWTRLWERVEQRDGVITG